MMGEIKTATWALVFHAAIRLYEPKTVHCCFCYGQPESWVIGGTISLLDTCRGSRQLRQWPDRVVSKPVARRGKHKQGSCPYNQVASRVGCLGRVRFGSCFSGLDSNMGLGERLAPETCQVRFEPSRTILHDWLMSTT